MITSQEMVSVETEVIDLPGIDFPIIAEFIKFNIIKQSLWLLSSLL